MKKFALFLGIVFIAAFNYGSLKAQEGISAEDYADNVEYDPWEDGDNGGDGFGAWELDASTINPDHSNHAGWFIGDPAAAGITGMNTASFGLYAHPEDNDNWVNADRSFSQSLAVGATFSFQWGVNFDSGEDGNKGFNLYTGGTGGTEIININMGGSETITIDGATMFENYGTAAMTINIERTASDKIRVYATGRDEIEEYDEEFTITGAPDAFRFYASALQSGDERQPYFNNLKIELEAYITAQTGNWDTGSTWEGGEVPPDAATIIIKDGHTITLNRNASVAGITIESGATLIFQDDSARELTIENGGNFTNNGSLSHNNGILILKGNNTTDGSTASEFNYVIIDGNDTDMMWESTKIAGTLELKSGFLKDYAPELLDHSTLKYTSGADYPRDIEWNEPYNIIITNNTNFLLNAGAWEGEEIHPIHGNITIENGSTFDFEDSDKKITLFGDINLAGTLVLSTEPGGDFEIAGNWNRSEDPSGTFTPNNRDVFFTATSGTQELNGHTTFSYLYIDNSGSELIMNDGITVTEVMNVENGAVLNMGAELIDGAGNFELVAGGTLKIGSPGGISSSGATGNIQNTGSRTFANAATYHYIYSGAEETVYSGTALPNTGAAKNIIIELGSNDIDFIVNTINNITINSPGKLQIISGTLIEPENEADGKYIYGADGLLEMSGGNYEIASISDTDHKPRLGGTYNITGGTIIFSGNGNQFLRGTRDYHNLTFSANTNTKLSSAISNVPGTVLIEDNAVVDAENRTFGDASTNLTITGGRLIMTGTGTKPDMRGTYNITGGTIEFGNNSATVQTIRGTDLRVYNNIDVSGSNVANSAGNIHINSIFTVKEDAQFRIASTYYVVGSGSFVMENNSTLRYGHANGITLQVEGTAASAGNIRTVTRAFNQNASYGLIGGVDMVTGNGLPASIQNLIIDKTNHQATLSQNLEVTGTLTLTERNILTGDNTLFVSSDDPAAIVDGGTNSYIIGNLKRQIATTGGNYLFPIGVDGSYNYVEINFTDLPTSTGTITASFIEDVSDFDYYGNLPIYDDDDQIVDNVSDKGCWEIIAEGLAGYTYDITVSGGNFEEGEDYDIIDPDKLRVIKRTNRDADWVFEGMHDGGTNDPPTVTRTGLTGFSIFAMGGEEEENVLPIELLSFNAEKLFNNIEVKWTTASETNNDYFTLLRSADGRNFEPIAMITGAGNSNAIIDYKYRDNNPVRGVNYYQLKQTDFDGTTSLSDMVAVDYSVQNEHKIFYNNKNILVSLPWEESEPVDYYIYDAGGRLLMNGQYRHSPGQTKVINTGNLGKGMAIIILTGERNTVTRKIIVK